MLPIAGSNGSPVFSKSRFGDCWKLFSLILTGAILLSLPFAAKEGTGTPFLSALFTATSATCVTGLSVYDIYTHFTLFGQIVIMGLIQLGGLGLVTLSTFFYTMIGKRMGLRTANLAKESVTADDRTDVKRLLRTIVLLTLCFEGAGAALMLPYFLPDYGGYGVFMSVFLRFLPIAMRDSIFWASFLQAPAWGRCFTPKGSIR